MFFHMQHVFSLRILSNSTGLGSLFPKTASSLRSFEFYDGDSLNEERQMKRPDPFSIPKDDSLETQVLDLGGLSNFYVKIMFILLVCLNTGLFLVKTAATIILVSKVHTEHEGHKDADATY